MLSLPLGVVNMMMVCKYLFLTREVLQEVVSSNIIKFLVACCNQLSKALFIWPAWVDANTIIGINCKI